MWGWLGFNGIFFLSLYAIIKRHEKYNNHHLLALLTLVYLGMRYHSAYSGQLRAWLQDMRALVGMGLLGLGLSAVMLLSIHYQMSMSPRGSGEASKSSQLLKSSGPAEGAELKSAFLRMFSTNLEGSAMDFTGWYNYFESPLLYCGLLVLLLLPQLFHYLTGGKERKVYAGVFFGLALIFLIPFLRHAFWLFTGSYYRFLSLLFVIIVLLCSMRALDYLAKGAAIYRKTLLFTLGLLCLPLFLSIPYHKGWHAVVNGRERPLFKVFNGLTGIPLNIGTYDIELRFENPYRFIGTLVSVASLLLLAGMLVFQKNYKN